MTSERAEYSAISSTNGTGGSITAERMVITRDTQAGPNLGRITLTLTNLATSQGNRVGTVTIVGMSGGTMSLNMLETILNVKKPIIPSSSIRPPSPTTIGFAPIGFDSVTATNIVSPANGGTTKSSLSVGQIVFTDVVLTNDTNQFETVSLKDLAYEDDEAVVTIASLDAQQAASALSQFFASPATTAFSFRDLMAASLGGLNVTDVLLTFKKDVSGAFPLKTVSLKSLAVGKISDGFIDQFDVSGFSAVSGEGTKAWQMGLARLGINGLNLRYFQQLRRGMMLSALYGASRTGQSATPSSALPARTDSGRVLLKDIQRGGPLDSGVAGVDLVDFNFSGGGFNFNIDKTGLKQTLNSDRVITQVEFIPTLLRLTLPSLPQSGDQSLGLGSVSALFAGLQTNELRLRIEGKAQFNPRTDTVVVDNYFFQLDDWGRLDMNIAMTGINRYMAEASMEDIIAAMSPSKPKAGADSQAATARLLGAYKGIAITSGSMEFADLGGLDKAARMAVLTTPRGAMARGAAAQRAPSQQPPPSAPEIAEKRTSWALSLRNQFGDKSKPLLLRQFSIGAARFFEGGGALSINANPPTPILISDMATMPANPSVQWGIRITNKAPTTTR